jgi:hypothetical protein
MTQEITTFDSSCLKLIWFELFDIRLGSSCLKLNLLFGASESDLKLQAIIAFETKGPV